MLYFRQILVLSVALATGACNEGGAKRKDGFGAVGRPIFKDDSVPSPSSETAKRETDPAKESSQGSPMTAGSIDDRLNFNTYKQFVASLALDDATRQQVPDQLQLASADQSDDQNSPVARTNLDVALVVDVTGSMGDELGYLQSELKTVLDDIVADHPGVEMRLGLVAYRDHGDEFVVDSHPFDAEIAAFQANLAHYSASGGGDTPEAMDEALVAAKNLQWNSANTTAKVMFLLADAPPHPEQVAASLQTFHDLQSEGVIVSPIGASGVDSYAEFVMRTGAVITGGEYIFLTDDSGIGNPHEVPHIPCYQVTLLKDQIRRVIDEALAGTRVEPKAATVIRTVGQPDHGKCSG